MASRCDDKSDNGPSSKRQKFCQGEIDDGDERTALPARLPGYSQPMMVLPGIPEEEEISGIVSLAEVAGERGHRSVYLEAFRTSLHTVSESESHLFSEKEKAVFKIWNDLNWEAQYIYVRLFLRKKSLWHRCHLLSYGTDVSDMGIALQTLQKKMHLSPVSSINSNMCQDSPDSVTEFTFLDSMDEHIRTAEQALALLSLEELKTLAKTSKVVARSKSEIISGLIRMCATQSTFTPASVQTSTSRPVNIRLALSRNKEEVEGTLLIGGPEARLVKRVLGTTGPCVRVSGYAYRLFQRVHMVYQRVTEWSEKPLLSIILANTAKRNYVPYFVSRTGTIFRSRSQLLEFEEALRLDCEVEGLLSSRYSEKSLNEIVARFDSIVCRWRQLLLEEQNDESKLNVSSYGSYPRSFSAAHIYTRIAHRTAHTLGRLHDYAREYALLTELLCQRLFHPARRGAWYQRKSLLEERYMYSIPSLDGNATADLATRRKFWRQKSAITCAMALQDQNCHLIYHYDLQRRLVRLEKQLRIPRRLQHNFSHVQLLEPEEEVVRGIRIRKNHQDPGLKTLWLVDSSPGGNANCSVEMMCLHHYNKAGWKGLFSEGGIVRTLFAYLFFDILFLDVPHVFQTAYQTCPLDLHTETFYATRALEIHERLRQISSGRSESILRDIYALHAEKQPAVVGLDWHFELDDLIEITQSLHNGALASICQVLCQEYKQRVSGLPDLLLWRTHPKPEAVFVEVKSENDHLSDTQRMWIHTLVGAGARVILCKAEAKEVRDYL